MEVNLNMEEILRNFLKVGYQDQITTYIQFHQEEPDPATST